MNRNAITLLLVCSLNLCGADTLPGTQPLTFTGDFSAEMVAGIGKVLDRQLDASIAGRAQFWKHDFASADAYEKSITPNRERLRKIIGAVDPRLPVEELEFIDGTPCSKPEQLDPGLMEKICEAEHAFGIGRATFYGYWENAERTKVEPPASAFSPAFTSATAG